jgi:hypothetical protein
MNCFLCPYSLGTQNGSPAMQVGSFAPVNVGSLGSLEYGAYYSSNNVGLSYYAPLDATGTSGTSNATLSGDLIINTGQNIVTQLGPTLVPGCNFTALTPPSANPSPFVRSAVTPAQSNGIVLRHGITAPHRVVGAGFEVTNTTAPLYKSGSVVTYDSPSNWGELDTFMVGLQTGLPAAPVANHGAFVNTHFKVMMGPPTTLDQAILMPNSKQWSAEEGAYCVAKFSSMDNEVTCATSNVYSGSGTGQQANIMVCQQLTATDSIGTGYFPNFITNQLQFYNLGNYNAYPFNGVGSWFTGLDTANSSFQITVKWYLEVFPNTFYEQNLIPTTSPSACYDPVALEVYARVVTQLPPAVPVKDNFLGLIGAAVGGLAKAAVGGIKNAISNGGSKSAVDVAQDWRTAVNKHGGGSNGVSAAMRDSSYNFMPIKDLAKQNLLAGVPQIRANFVDEGVAEPTMENAARMYHMWFGNPPNAVWPHATYPGEEPGGATHAMVGTSASAGLPIQSHACNCPPHPNNGYGNSTGNRSMEFLDGINLNPQSIVNLIQSSVDKGINAAVRKLAGPQFQPAPQRRFMPPQALAYDDYEDTPEASEAVRNRRRLARQKRAAELKRCRDAGVIPKISPPPPGPPR